MPGLRGHHTIRIVADVVQKGRHLPMVGRAMSEREDDRQCVTPGYPRDGRYAPPGRGHIAGCKNPVPPANQINILPKFDVATVVNEFIAGHPCQHGHRPAWLVSGGIACGICRVRLS